MSLQGWAIDKALDLSGAALRRAMQVDDPVEVLRGDISHIKSDLQMLSGAPFNEALMHLGEGNSDRAVDRLRTAIATNPLDFSAWILFIKLLRAQERFDLAKDYTCEFLDIFGFRDKDVSEELFEAYTKLYFSTPVMNSPVPSEISAGDYMYNWFPQEVWCSHGGIAVLFRKEFS